LKPGARFRNGCARAHFQSPPTAFRRRSSDSSLSGRRRPFDALASVHRSVPSSPDPNPSCPRSARSTPAQSEIPLPQGRIGMTAELAWTLHSEAVGCTLPVSWKMKMEIHIRGNLCQNRKNSARP
jgi:hypothetical protein